MPGEHAADMRGETEPDLLWWTVIHRAIRQDLAEVAAVSADSAVGSAGTPQAEAICRFTMALLAEVSAHHRDEDDIFWPVVAAAAGQSIDLAPLTDDHKAIDAALGQVRRTLTAFAAHPHAFAAALPASVSNLYAMLDDHIGDTEAQVLPVMRRYLSAEAYESCLRQARRNASLSRLTFRVPWLARHATSGELQRLRAGCGWSTQILQVAARPRYARMERRAFGTRVDPAGPAIELIRSHAAQAKPNPAGPRRGRRQRSGGTLMGNPAGATRSTKRVDRAPGDSNIAAGRLERRIRAAEARLFARYGLVVEESFAELASSGLRLRILTAGAGPDLVLLHGSALTSAIWVPWLSELRGYRVRMVDLPGHGLSSPVSYRPGEVRQAAVELIDDLLGVLHLETAPVIGHSVGGMYALWHAAERPGKICFLTLIGAPGGALPGLRLRVPVNLLTLPGVGEAMLRMPSPRPIYRSLVAHGMGSKLPAAPAELIEVLRLSARQSASAASVAALHRATDLFTKPRPETVMTDTELASVTVPVLFCWGRDDPYLDPAAAAPYVAGMPRGLLRVVSGAHAPWLDDPSGCGCVVTDALSEAGVGPQPDSSSQPARPRPNST